MAIIRILFLWLVFTNAGVKVAVVIENAKSGAPVVSYPGTSKETSKLPKKTAVDQPPI